MDAVPERVIAICKFTFKLIYICLNQIDLSMLKDYAKFMPLSLSLSLYKPSFSSTFVTLTKNVCDVTSVEGKPAFAPSICFLWKYGVLVQSACLT